MSVILKRLVERTPLAVAALETLAFVIRPEVIDPLYDRHRGKGYTGELSFSGLLDMLSVALLQDGGSGHRQYVVEGRGPVPVVDSSNFYRKLAKMNPQVSLALLREPTRELLALAPPNPTLLPGCFESMEVIVLDGKKVKNVAKKLAPTRGFTGALLGAAALVAMPLRSGVAIAMSYSLDGEANDVPLVPSLLPQVREVIARPILFIADRQFCDSATLNLLSERQGDRFVVRIRKGLIFRPDPTHLPKVSVDDAGREIVDEVGAFGGGKQPLRLRRITLRRAQEEVVLVTDLLDPKQFDANDLLKLYRKRWGIEQLFQQVTQTFSLQHLIGCSPNAVLLQLAFCLLLYNVTQIARSYLAADGGVPRESVSMFTVFEQIQRGLTTWLMMSDEPEVKMALSIDTLRERLLELTRSRWRKTYLSHSDRKPRVRGRKKTTEGLHTSVHKLMSAAKAKRKTP